MINSVSRNRALNTQFVPLNSLEKSGDKKVLTFLQSQFKAGGLLGDFAGGLKLANFWTETICGAATESSKKMTEAGGLIKNYLGILDLPGRVSAIGTSFEGLKRGTVEGVAEFTNSVLGAGKSVVDGVELAGKRFGLLSKDTVRVLSPLNHFSPAAAFSFGATQATFKNIPAIRENWGVRADHVSSNLIKLAKHVAVASVGALALIASFFKPICAIWVIPSLLTALFVFSVADRFFEGLILSAKAKHNPI